MLLNYNNNFCFVEQEWINLDTEVLEHQSNLSISLFFANPFTFSYLPFIGHKYTVQICTVPQKW